MKTIIIVGLIAIISISNVIANDEKFTAGLGIGFLVGIATVLFGIMYP